jgi:hypothetical protein
MLNYKNTYIDRIFESHIVNNNIIIIEKSTLHLQVTQSKISLLKSSVCFVL